MKNAELTNTEEISEVVKEVREMRQKLLTEFGNDRSRLYAHFREVEEELRKSGKYKFADPSEKKPKSTASTRGEAAD